MPVMRFAGAALRKGSKRDNVENGPDSLLMDDQQKNNIMRDIGLLTQFNPVGIAKWVFDPRPTAAGTLDEARAKGLLK